MLNRFLYKPNCAVQLLDFDTVDVYNKTLELYHMHINYIVMCIPIAKQRHGKQTLIIETLFFVGSAPWPLLCNDSVNTLQR
jgi:hypothetical protein